MRRKIGFWEAFSIGVGGMIGGGIFAVLGLSVQLSKSGAPIAFAIAGIVALTTAYSYAKLSVRFPSRGGTVEFLVKAYGTGILSGSLNVLLLLSYVVMIALYAYAFGSYGATMIPLPKPILCITVIAFFTFLNALGAVVSGKAEDALVVFKLSILVLICLAGIIYINPERLSIEHWADPLSLIAGGMVIFLAYEGFELIANTGEDVENPKVLSKAFYASVLLVIAVYIGIAIVTVGTLSYGEIVGARDYALAKVAEPILGKIGFVLVGLSALASTSSAINATLYGTARISYMVAKYGQIPEIVEKRLWKEAYEGLIIVSVLSIVLATCGSLESISTAGSGGFLIIFLAVNLAALKLRKMLKVNLIIPSIGVVLTSLSLAILILRMSLEDLRVLLILVFSSFAIEVVYRTLSGRRISEFVSDRLRRREESITTWREWIEDVMKLLKDEWRDADIYLAGSIARGEVEKAHDVDIVVVLDEIPNAEDVEKVKNKLKKLYPSHPIDLHFVRRKDFVRVEHVRI
ncbi:amino acid permease [Archaeoglobus sp.]